MSGDFMLEVCMGLDQEARSVRGLHEPGPGCP